MAAKKQAGSSKGKASSPKRKSKKELPVPSLTALARRGRR
jgi:hypothetical protein